MRGPATVVLVLTAAVLPACDDPLGGEWIRLTTAERRWRGAELHSYEFELSVFADRGGGLAVRVTVMDDAFAGITRLDLGPAPDTLDLQPYLTIDRIFARVADVLARGPGSFVATYDPEGGYPRSVSVDAGRGGSGFMIANLRPPVRRLHGR